MSFHLKVDFYEGFGMPPKRALYPETRKMDGRKFMAWIAEAHAGIQHRKPSNRQDAEACAVVNSEVAVAIRDGLNSGIGRVELRYGLPTGRAEVWADYMSLLWELREPGTDNLVWELRPWVIEAVEKVNPLRAEAYRESQRRDRHHQVDEWSTEND